MKKIFVSDVWNINNSGHENLDFVDVALNKDNLLFIDPCLIENWDNAWAKKAMCTINSFFSEFYSAYRDNDRLLKHSLLSHAREQNATRLGFSDLLTNIIHSELNDFTLTQMNKYNIAPNSTTTFYSWDSSLQNWVQVESPCYRYGKDELLLVPKQIVRKNYLFGIGQYFERIILERKQAEDNWRDDKGKPIPKREIAKNLRTDDEHWQ